MKQDISPEKTEQKCSWFGTTLDLTLSYRGNRTPQQAYPIHSSFRAKREASSVKA